MVVKTKLTVPGEFVHLEEVLGVFVKRNFAAEAVVFGSQEELDNNGLSDFTVDIDADLEVLVVQTGTLNEYTDFVFDNLS